MQPIRRDPNRTNDQNSGGSMMKKSFAILLAVLFLFALAGCIAKADSK
jgi:hypothetical protein